MIVRRSPTRHRRTRPVCAQLPTPTEVIHSPTTSEQRAAARTWIHGPDPARTTPTKGTPPWTPSPLTSPGTASAGSPNCCTRPQPGLERRRRGGARLTAARPRSRRLPRTGPGQPLLPNDYKLSKDVEPREDLDSAAPLQLLTGRGGADPAAAWPNAGTGQQLAAGGRLCDLIREARDMDADAGVWLSPTSTRRSSTDADPADLARHPQRRRARLRRRHIARQLLMDVSGDDAGTAAHELADLVAAAARPVEPPAREGSAQAVDSPITHHPPVSVRAATVRPASARRQLAAGQPARPTHMTR